MFLMILSVNLIKKVTDKNKKITDRNSAIRGKEDHLLGLKENVIIGKIIPAGTGMFRYRNIEPLADLTNAPEVEEVETETVEN